MRSLRISLLAIVTAQCLGLASCGPPAIEGGFGSANPAAKMYAVEQAAQAGDHSALCCIVEQLDSDDPAVRSLAITTLVRLTGQTYGYHDFDPPQQRREAIARWVRAFHAGEIHTRPAAAGPVAGSPAVNSSDHAAELGAAPDHG